jgi:Protein of unknown function (DUF3179)
LTPDANRSAADRGRNASARAAIWIALVGALISVVCLAIPMYVIRPFRPQDPSQLAVALTVRGLAPWITALSAIVVLFVVIRAWKKLSLISRIALAALSLFVVAGAVLTHVNIFEIMFHPYDSPAFGPIASAQIDADDKVLAVKIGGEAHAYPIRTMGYHHVVNDTVGGEPIAATYCTLCHTGLVWSRLLDGRTLHFRLAGINNGNALIRDEETSTIWQQSTGQGIFGPLKGRQLGLIHSDELTFSLWTKEQPQGVVLDDDASYASQYDHKDWEQEVERTRTVVDTRQSGIAPHELMLGITIGDSSKAYPVKAILSANMIQDQVAKTPILLVVGPDKASIRVFQTGEAGGPMTFVPVPAANPNSQQVIRDVETESTWNFEGCAVEGRLKGQCLKPLDSNKDYWFDWMNHHPATTVFHI